MAVDTNHNYSLATEDEDYPDLLWDDEEEYWYEEEDTQDLIDEYWYEEEDTQDLIDDTELSD